MVKLTHRSLLILAAFCIWLIGFSANAANLTATVSSNQVTKAEVFQLRLTYDKKVDADALDFSSLESTFFLGQPSFGSSLNYINGKRSSRSEWTVALKAKQLGTLTIPAFSIEGNQSQPIRIQVSQDKDLPQPNELALIQSQLDKTTLYPNETTQLKTRLIIKSDPRRMQNVHFTPPTGSGFSIKQIGQPNQYQTVINGLEATVVEQTFDVTAEQAGQHQLDSLGFEATFVFGSNRSGTTKLLPVKLAPEKFELEIKPKPTNSNNAWLPTSQLELSQEWISADGTALDPSKQSLTVNVGDSITRQLTLSIQGIDAQNFPAIVVEYPEAIRQYAEKPQFTQLENGVTQMTVQQVLIAQHQGQTQLPAISVEWFNTLSEAKQLSQVDGLNLEIKPAPNAVANPIVIPEVAPSQTNTSAGFWPYLTMLFASLWLITLIWHFKSRHQPNTTYGEETKTSSQTRQLIEAIKAGDAVKGQYLAKQWLTTQKNKNDHLLAEISSELETMAASQYSNQSANWSSKKLIKLINKLDKHKRSKPDGEKLAKL